MQHCLEIEAARNWVIPEYAPPYTTEKRPDFGPTQVRNVSELKAGKPYAVHTAGGCLLMGHHDAMGEAFDYNPPLPIIFISADLTGSENPIPVDETDVDGKSIRVRYPGVKINHGVLVETRGEEDVYLFSIGLGTDVKNRWHSYNWLEDPTKDIVEEKPKLGPQGPKRIAHILFSAITRKGR
jgi:hypothetical protein